MKCLCVFIKENQKKNYLEKSDINDRSVFKKFQKTVKQIFVSKIKSRNSITLGEGTKLIQEQEIAETFHELFVSVVNTRGINENFLPNSSSQIKNIEYIIAKFENHAFIMTIQNYFDKNCIFSFKKVIEDEVISEIKNLEIKKESLSNVIFAKIITELGGLLAVSINEILIYS